MDATPTIEITPDPSGGYRLLTEMLIDLPLEQVFPFFADAMQLGSITPPFLNFSVLTPQPVEMRVGLLLDYKLSLHRIPIKWRTEIAAWEPPYRFVDTQVRGPYKRWYHEHTFEPVDGQTLVKDNVHYIPRGGSLVHRWFVKPDLLKIFAFRQRRIKEIFDARISQLELVASV